MKPSRGTLDFPVFLEGNWLNATAYGKARRQEGAKAPLSRTRKSISRDDFVTRYEVHIDPLTAWAHLSETERFNRTRGLVDEIEAEARQARGGSPVMGAQALCRESLERRGSLPALPWFETRRRLICWGHPKSRVTQEYVDRYWAFQHAYREASAAISNEGVRTVVQFPPGSFQPGRFHAGDGTSKRLAA